MALLVWAYPAGSSFRLTAALMREVLTGWIDLIDLIINLNLVLGYFSKERLIFIG